MKLIKDGVMIRIKLIDKVIIFSNYLTLMSEEIDNHVIAQYKVIKKIGSGAYGHVWKVQDRKTKCLKALKKLRCILKLNRCSACVPIDNVPTSALSP